MRAGVLSGRRGLRAPVVRATGAVVTAAVVLSLSGCSLFRHDDTSTVSALDVKPGDCALAPAAITTEVTNLKVVPCTDPHEQEVYAVVPYTGDGGTQTEMPYPGEAALKAFADGACLEAFSGYVGSDYRDSSLFFTYLLPSARGWQQGSDHDVTCFITTTGDQMTASVKGSGL